MNYLYCRVSSHDQNEERQIEAYQKWAMQSKVKVNEIFVDKQSGKDFNRPNYQYLRGILKEGDTIIIKSIDRLGRNYDMIIEEWSYLTKTLKCDIVVLDMPDLLDTRVQKNGLTGKFISDLVLQILSYVAQTERENIKQRQAEGIKIAKEKGVKFGRDLIYPKELWEKIRDDYIQNTISINALGKKYGINRLSVLRHCHNEEWEKMKQEYGRNKVSN